MSTPYLGEIRMTAFNFAPKGWAFCNGQLLAISQNQALFSILGTTYGGNGINNFALPDLRGRVPAHFGTSPVFGNTIQQGERAGEENHTLSVNELPMHIHLANASADTNSVNMQSDPTNAYPANSGNPGFAPASGSYVTMAPGALSNTGGSQPHSNMPPYLVCNFIISLQGIYPSRS